MISDQEFRRCKSIIMFVRKHCWSIHIVHLLSSFIIVRRLRNARTRINTEFFLSQNKTTPHWFVVKLRCRVTISHIHQKGVVPT
jgi:hypothetical protein